MKQENGSIVKVGIVGCGGIASHHAKSYVEVGGAELCAFCDVSAERAERLAQEFGGRAYTDLGEMLDGEELQAVSLLTPPAVRFEPVRAIAEHGVHIFCEKPLATSVEEARKLIDVTRENGVHLLVAVCHRFHEPVRRVRELLDEGKMGEVKMFRNRFGYRFGMPLEELKGRGGILLDNGAHSVDLFRFLAGEPVLVFARGDRSDDITCLRDCICLLETAEGARGVIELNGTVPKSKGSIEVYATGGSAYIDYAAESVFVPAEGKPVVLDDKLLPPLHRFHREISHFLDCVRGKAQPVIGADEGLRDVIVMEACFRSIQEGRPVEIEM